MRRVVFLTVVVSVLAAAAARPQQPTKPVKAAALTEALVKDEKALNSKYNGKTLLVEGKVVAVEAEPGGIPKIRFAGHAESDAKPVPIRVVCRFPSALRDKVKKVEKGATVKVKGVFGGASLSLRTVMIEDCQLVK